ncbi:MAG: hypothetical protein RL095_1165 [Verrucomicrobiota bacterium]|jgi:RNA polymerase sigma factor (sigma-70 family)
MKPLLPEDRYRTRPTLLRRVKTGDEPGWAEFYAYYSPLIFWLCSRRGVTSEEARALVVQAVMIHCARQDWDESADKGRFRNYILRVSELKIHEVRREMRQITLLPEDALTAPSDASTEEKESLEHALDALAADPEVNPAHLPILQSALAGLSVAETARQSGLSEANVKVIRHRLLHRLRKHLDE